MAEPTPDITRDEIAEKLGGIFGDKSPMNIGGKSAGVAAALAAFMFFAFLAYLSGRRRGRKGRTIVEVKRV